MQATGIKDRKNQMLMVGDSVDLYFYPDEELNRENTVTKRFQVEFKNPNDELFRKHFPNGIFILKNGQDERVLDGNLHIRVEKVCE